MVESNVVAKELMDSPATVSAFDEISDPPTVRLLERNALRHAVPEAPKS